MIKRFYLISAILLLAALVSCQSEEDEPQQSDQEPSISEETPRQSERELKEDELGEIQVQRDSHYIELATLEDTDSFQIILTEEDGIHLIGSDTLYNNKGIWTHYLKFLHGDRHLTEMTVSTDVNEGTIEWMNQIEFTNQTNGYNAFLLNPGILGEFNSKQSLYIEPEVKEGHVDFHLAAVDYETGAIKRMREAFWTVTDENSHDSIYQYVWDPKLLQLFVQTRKGNVWLFDLKDGNDHFHRDAFPVIPHSATGAPSLFLSPAMDRFAFDREIGKLELYKISGEKIASVPLPNPENHWVSSHKMKWSPQGLIAWMESSPAQDSARIKAIDIDYLGIAPQIINFFDRNGNPLSSLEAKTNQAIEVVDWKEGEQSVLIMQYEIKELDDSKPYPENFKKENVSYFLYDLTSGDQTRIHELEELANENAESKIGGNNENISDGEWNFEIEKGSNQYRLIYSKVVFEKGNISNIPLHFEPIDIQKNVHEIDKNSIQVIKEEWIDDGKFIVFTKEEGSDRVYGGLEIDDKIFDLGNIGYAAGDLELINIDKVEVFNKNLYKVTGYCGATCHINSYIELVTDKPQIVLHLESAAMEIDLDDDGIKEIVTSIGTPTETYIYKMIDKQIFAANINKSLGALSVTFKDSLFEAYSEQTGETTKHSISGGDLILVELGDDIH